ncbi:hypothetical protein [Pedobacter xixiisoli]|uniref:Uncharacterized protein n=1 Tax=Pedobacter xixiisoli TaxID=1476464 RepID=A0A286A9M4_9SPHI|nr:hypothetical protein [Pedobacter xixiisoli]SOD18614.1 hypothetical protein SAMN06297358_3097 [Pedobacter xixiisoli]
MKNIIIITPLFPPSNVASVHRSRLFAQHLPKFGWNPIIVTVDEKYHDFNYDWDIVKLLPENLRIEKVNAISNKKIKIINEIGIRAFYQLYKRVLKIVRNEKIDFIYIPIPTFYTALIGRLIYRKTKIRYGIDYIDPWVYKLPQSTSFLGKYWLSMQINKILEPISIKHASLITGVAPGYYEDVLIRNPKLKDHVVTTAMPYGGEKRDNLIATELKLNTYIFKKVSGKLDFVYAGAMLPKAFETLNEILKSIKKNKDLFTNIRFHFIGTGTSPDDPNGFNIKELAQKYELWNDIIFEYPKRIPYLDVLSHLNAADGTFILGSTEPHYTPSKIYQSILSEKPVFAVLHKKSSACQVVKSTNIGTLLAFDGEDELSLISKNFAKIWSQHLNFISNFSMDNVNLSEFDQYSAEMSTMKLAESLDKVIGQNNYYENINDSR